MQLTAQGAEQKQRPSLVAALAASRAQVADGYAAVPAADHWWVSFA